MLRFHKSSCAAKFGRASQAALGIVPVDVRAERPPPPERLSEAEKRLWERLIESRRPGWFAGALGLLARYCVAIVEAERIEEALRNAEAGSDQHARLARLHASRIARCYIGDKAPAGAIDAARPTHAAGRRRPAGGVMRNISFMHTTPQFRARTKTVTRRMGWGNLKVGDVLCAVEKNQGLPRGGKVVRLGPIKVTDVRREPLRRLLDDLDYGLAETTREGFPSGDPLHSPSEFVEFFCRTHKGCTPHSEVTRIEYTYL